MNAEESAPRESDAFAEPDGIVDGDSFGYRWDRLRDAAPLPGPDAADGRTRPVVRRIPPPPGELAPGKLAPGKLAAGELAAGESAEPSRTGVRAGAAGIVATVVAALLVLGAWFTGSGPLFVVAALVTAVAVTLLVSGYLRYRSL